MSNLDTGGREVTPSRYRHETGTDTYRFSPYGCRQRQRKERLVRKILLMVVMVLALGLAGTATAGHVPSPGILCGTCGQNGGGYTGCSQASTSDSGGIPYIAHYRHYLVVSFCKRYGIVTSVSIAAHGCDIQGIVVCSTGPAWQTGGGVGYGSASFTGHATWWGTINGIPYASSSVVNLTI
jgi:hypothetical protein